MVRFIRVGGVSLRQPTSCDWIDWIVATTNAKGQAFHRCHGAAIFDTVCLARFNAQAIQGLVGAEAGQP